MASTKEYSDFILEQLSGLDEITARKMMLLVDNVDNRDFLKELVLAMYDELPEVKKKKGYDIQNIRK